MCGWDWGEYWEVRIMRMERRGVGRWLDSGDKVVGEEVWGELNWVERGDKIG